MTTDSALAGTWDIDPSHTRIGFSARHAMVTKVRGAFNKVSGHVSMNPEDPSDVQVKCVSSWTASILATHSATNTSAARTFSTSKIIPK